MPDQNAITRDNVTVKVNAVIYYKVSDAEKAIIEVSISAMPFLNMLRLR